MPTNNGEGMVKSTHRNTLAVGCESPLARGISRNTARYAAFSIPATSFGGSDGMAPAMSVTLRVPRPLTPIRAAAPCESGTAVVNQIQLNGRLMKYKDATGQKFGRLTVIQFRSSVKNKAPMCLCSCECGTVKEFGVSNVLTGKSKSCGCLARDVTGERAKTHGMSKTPVYAVWARMWSRCTNPIVERYPQYGGRGIKVCARWEGFEEFLIDMGNLPTPLHSIGRIDNDGNYEPANCRWETREQQSNNTSRSVFIEWQGQRKTIAQWAGITGIPYSTLQQRQEVDMPLERMMDVGEDGLTKKYIEVDGDRRMTTEWMKDLSIPISSFYHFRRKGMSDADIVSRYIAKSYALKAKA